MKTKKTTPRKKYVPAKSYSGGGLLSDKEAKKLAKERAKKAKLPTSSADALRIEELTAKLNIAQEKVNETHGIVAVLKREFPERRFDPYLPNAVLAICQEYKLAVAQAAQKG